MKTENTDPNATQVITAEIKRLLGELRQVGGIDFALVLIEHEGNTHKTAVDINMTDDHHILDGLAATLDLWRKSNH